MPRMTRHGDDDLIPIEVIVNGEKQEQFIVVFPTTDPDGTTHSQLCSRGLPDIYLYKTLVEVTRGVRAAITEELDDTQ